MQTSWQDRYPYLDYIRCVDVRTLIEANRVCDTGADAGEASPDSCVLCAGPASARDAIRLNNGEWVCGSCFVRLQHTRYPEKYQKLYEVYLTAREAWRQALAELTTELETTYPTRHLHARVVSIQTWCWILIAVGVIASFVAPMFGLPLTAVVGIILAVSVSSLNSEIARCNGEITQAKTSWEAKNPQPSEPELRDFHDPRAELTERDRKLQDIFDYWPGYPPYWQYIRQVVIARDECCQITGCPSRTETHVHHRTPLARGGSHRPENLVALCVFHHGLQPDMGHERVWNDITTRYFSVVCAHMRAGVPVRAHVRRRSLATERELLDIMRFHSVCCPGCGSELLRLYVDYQGNKVSVSCKQCDLQKTLPQKLTEETGPQLCDELKPTENILSASVDWELMDGKRRPVGSRKSPKPRASRRNHQASKCPRCGSRLKMRNGKYGRFWGCSAFPRCRYTRGHGNNPGYRVV